MEDKTDRPAYLADEEWVEQAKIVGNSLRESHYSHNCCWNQGKDPACGQALENHKQCCLCPEPFNKEKSDIMQSDS